MTSPCFVFVKIVRIPITSPPLIHQPFIALLSQVCHSIDEGSFPPSAEKRKENLLLFGILDPDPLNLIVTNRKGWRSNREKQRNGAGKRLSGSFRHVKRKILVQQMLQARETCYICLFGRLFTLNCTVVRIYVLIFSVGAPTKDKSL